MSITRISLTTIQSLISDEKFYSRDFNVQMHFLTDDSPVIVNRFFVDGAEYGNNASTFTEMILDNVASSVMDQYEESLHQQKIPYRIYLDKGVECFSATYVP